MPSFLPTSHLSASFNCLASPQVFTHPSWCPWSSPIFSPHITKSLLTFLEHPFISIVKILTPRPEWFQSAMGVNGYILVRKTPDNAKKKNGYDLVAFQEGWRADKGDIWKLVMDQGLWICFLSNEKLNQGEKGMKGWILTSPFSPSSLPRQITVNINLLPRTQCFRWYSHATRNESEAHTRKQVIQHTHTLNRFEIPRGEDYFR